MTRAWTLTRTRAWTLAWTRSDTAAVRSCRTPVAWRSSTPGGACGLAGVDVVFPLLRGVFGDEGTVQGLLEMADLPYVGSGVFASSVAMDHEFARKLFAAEGIPVVPHAVLREGESLTESDRRRLGLPLSVKPARSSGGSHATRVDEWSRLEEAVADAGEGKVLVEALPPGWSVVVGVLEGERDGVPQSSAPIRLPEADPESVADEDQNEPTPNGLHRDVAVKLEDYAVRAFAALDCAGLARVDFLVTVEHEIYLRGVDTMPSLSPRSPFVRAWTARGIEYPKLVSRLIRTAVRRGTGLH